MIQARALRNFTPSDDSDQSGLWSVHRSWKLCPYITYIWVMWAFGYEAIEKNIWLELQAPVISIRCSLEDPLWIFKRTVKTDQSWQNDHKSKVLMLLVWCSAFSEPSLYVTFIRHYWAGSWYSILLTLINSGTFPWESSQGGITARTASSMIWMPTLRETSLICLHCQKPTFGGDFK